MLDQISHELAQRDAADPLSPASSCTSCHSSIHQCCITNDPASHHLISMLPRNARACEQIHNRQAAILDSVTTAAQRTISAYKTPHVMVRPSQTLGTVVHPGYPRQKLALLLSQVECEYTRKQASEAPARPC